MNSQDRKTLIALTKELSEIEKFLRSHTQFYKASIIKRLRLVLKTEANKDSK